MDILREYHHAGSDRNRARLYRNIDPESIFIMRNNLYFKHYGATACYIIKLDKKENYFMNPDEIKETMKYYVWNGDDGENMFYYVKDRILEFLGDNVDYYISPLDYETAADFKKAVYTAIMDGDYMNGDTPEETITRRNLVQPVLDEIFQESITEQDFIAMKAERE
jgi:hypothetical protein